MLQYMLLIFHHKHDFISSLIQFPTSFIAIFAIHYKDNSFFHCSTPASPGVQRSVPTMPPFPHLTPPPSPRLSFTPYRAAHSRKETMSSSSSLTTHSLRTTLPLLPVAQQLWIPVGCRSEGGKSSPRGSSTPFMWSLLTVIALSCKMGLSVGSAVVAIREETGCGNCRANTRYRDMWKASVELCVSALFSSLVPQAVY